MHDGWRWPNIWPNDYNATNMVYLITLYLILSCVLYVYSWKFPVAISRASFQKDVTSRRAALQSQKRLTSSNAYQNEIATKKTTIFSFLDKSRLYGRLNREFAVVSLPAFVALVADPLASMVDAIYVARLGAVDQAAMGIAISAQYSVAKLYNDPLLKTSTSLVASKKGEELEASVAMAIATAMIIGTIQSLVFLFGGKFILSIMGVGIGSEMRAPAFEYLKWRALGIPAATVLIVTNGIFRGRGDTQTPLYCTVLGNIVNIVLDPVLIFTMGMGCAGAGAATAVSQWVTAIPLLYLLNRAVPIKIFGRSKSFFKDALLSYVQAGGLIFIRTVAKIAAYTVTASAAARLGTVPMAAYSLTFNLGFATSQLCESISIAAQALLARDYPFKTAIKKKGAGHVMRLSLFLGMLVSTLLSLTTWFNQDAVLNQLTKSPAVYSAAAAIMPIVLITQLFKSLAYSTGGIILGGLDWFWSSVAVQIASAACIGLTLFLPNTLNNIWISLAAFMAIQVVVALIRVSSGTGPWRGINLLDLSEPGEAEVNAKEAEPNQDKNMSNSTD